MSRLASRHLLGLRDVSSDDITMILDTAETFREVLDRPVKKLPTLRGITVLNLFYEPSTRTKISFELAEKRLVARNEKNWESSDKLRDEIISKGYAISDEKEGYRIKKN